MAQTSRQSFRTENVLSVIMGGGQGSRLFPLTKERAKPAVPLGGKYRLVDVPISNCIHSGFRRIYLLTQFNSASLHRHISQSYKFDSFSRGFVEVLAAEQTYSDTSWYQGTADAVRKNKTHFGNLDDWDYLLILSGDQLYRMNFGEIINQHIQTGAEITIATKPVRRADVPGLGIMKSDVDHRITQFVEKPKDPAVQDELRVDPTWYPRLGIEGEGEYFLASMGIYVFNRRLVFPESGDRPGLLDNTLPDFGKDIIPQAIRERRAFSFVYQGYWEDVGTIRSFFEANLDLASELPRFNFFDMSHPIFSRPRFLPGSKINGAAIDHAVVSDGCIINQSRISHSIIGLRSIVGPGTRLDRTVLLGCDYYESETSIKENEAKGIPRMGIGDNCRIDNTIIDKNAHIGDNVIISPSGKPETLDDKDSNFYIRDGIVVVPKGAVIRSGTVI